MGETEEVWNSGVFGVELRGFWCGTEGDGTEGFCEHNLN